MTVSIDETPTGDSDPLSTFRERLERAAARANQGCGLIYELYVERLSAEVSDLPRNHFTRPYGRRDQACA